MELDTDRQMLPDDTVCEIGHSLGNVRLSRKTSKFQDKISTFKINFCDFLHSTFYHKFYGRQ